MNTTTHIKSVLEPLIQDVYQAKNLEEGKEKMKTLINNTKIKALDKQKMLYTIDNDITNLTKLQFYATNCMFKYIGLGISGSSRN